MIHAAWSSPIHYVGQPTVIRNSQSMPWIKANHVLINYKAQPAQRRSMSSTPSPPPSPSPSPTPSDVPTAVSTLLGLTKQLQDVLRLWSMRQADEGQVSDAFVLVGMQFNATVNAFSRHGIDMSDLLRIPDDLRTVLELCLGEHPSPRTLDRYMPEVRTVLFRLLQGLKGKQAPYRRVVDGSRWSVPGEDEYGRFR